MPSPHSLFAKAQADIESSPLSPFSFAMAVTSAFAVCEPNIRVTCYSGSEAFFLIPREIWFVWSDGGRKRGSQCNSKQEQKKRAMGPCLLTFSQSTCSISHLDDNRCVLVKSWQQCSSGREDLECLQMSRVTDKAKRQEQFPPWVTHFSTLYFCNICLCRKITAPNRLGIGSLILFTHATSALFIL